MYELTKPLTKIVNIDGKECVSCIYYGTPECLIHSKGTRSCPECVICHAIYNKLYLLEGMISDGKIRAIAKEE